MARPPGDWGRGHVHHHPCRLVTFMLIANGTTA